VEFNVKEPLTDTSLVSKFVRFLVACTSSQDRIAAMSVLTNKDTTKACLKRFVAF
jgi:hypothetical protein